MDRTPNRMPVSTRLQRIAEVARSNAGTAIKVLSYHLDVDLLTMAHELTSRTSAPGIDGYTAEFYGVNLAARLTDRVDRVKSGRYRAPPVRRAYIPKANRKEMRAIGIPTVEDKVLQRAVLMLLEPIYEHDFLDCSYGFRPGRNAHMALETLWQNVMKLGGCWVLEVDIRAFFDTLDHRHLQAIVRQRVGDGVIQGLIGKWLNAGVLEGEALSYPERGTPQGGVISPLLANIYLHEVLDRWFQEMALPRLRGKAFLIRYADDFVMGFERLEDARKIYEVLPKRFGKYGLTLHPSKTRLIDFRHPEVRQRAGNPGNLEEGLPDTFDFLGFTHHWSRSKSKRWFVRRQTAKDRFTRSVRKISDWCRENLHLSVDEQRKKLALRVRGHYGYFGITGNMVRIQGFLLAVERTWYRWLNRRSQRPLWWWQFAKMLQAKPLPPPCLPHSVFRRANA